MMNKPIIHIETNHFGVITVCIHVNIPLDISYGKRILKLSKLY